MVKKAVALFVAYSFFANSLWSLTAQGVRVDQSTGPMNWHIATTVHADKHALTTSALSGATPAAAISSALTSATSTPRGPLDGDAPSTSCTIHSTQPSSDTDDGDNGYSTYARHDYKYGSNDHASGVAPSVVASGVTIFGPQTFVRTTGAPNEFDSTITVPAWIAQPFYLHVVNGDSSGNHRISSATVSINGVTLLSQSDFNQQMASADCAVNLTLPTSQLHVELASKPGSFLTLNILGQNQDHTPPVLTITAPASGSTVNTATPHIALSYNDVKGATEPAASGVNVPSLKVLLDSVDRTSLFTERPNDASADVPASLALSQGPHTITATIQDNAGNTATATSQFQVVTQSALAIQITQPQASSFLNSLSVPVQITYSDSVSINTSTLKVLVNGVDRTSLFTVTATGATGTVTGQQGANQIVASISDVSSAQASASSAFNIDTVPPTIAILHPVPGSTHGSSAVEYTVQYSDDQALDLTSLKILVDGTLQVVTPGASTASGTVTLADGNHTLTASIKDKTGNQATASSTFSVDTTAPSIHITQPAPGAIQNFASAQIQVQYGDNENINTASFKITIDGVDQTSFFTVTATGASASLPGPFGEGSHTIAAQIADQTGNVGQTSSTFVVDTIKPVLTLVSPVGPINTTSPSALAQYSDSGTGINTGSVHVFVDGSDVTSAFSVASTSVTGTLAGLSEGTHQFRVTVADRAGNVADQSVSFLVDVTPPAISFTAPANNVFINNTQPAVTLNYSDSGAGINQASLHIFLQAGSSPETEITSAFTIGASQANGTIGTPTPLTPGTYKLRAQVLDNAGNSSTAISAFQVDTQPPTYVIQLPAANSFLNTATPSLLVTYQDDSSGVDPAQFAIRVDGVDRTNRLTVTATSASGALLAGDALADGTHQVEVTVVDRAGNQAPIVPQSFLVDTTPPTISISAPGSGSFTNNNLFPISVTYADSGSGIDITKFHLTIDGIDQTAQFTATATGATGVPTAVLLDGVHTIVATIQDLAGNASSASVAFSVDTAPPQITITQPANGVFTNAASLIVTGSVVDASPVTVTIEGTAVPVQNNTFTSAGITLGTGATQLIHVVATDAAGNSSTVTLTINIDRTPPTITGAINPPPNAAGWNNTAVTVTFTCADADSGIATCPAPVQLATEGANQQVTGTAVDKAGNVAQATVTVNIDKTPPLITGTPAPAPNAAGWNITDVTITYICSDSLSGVLQCLPVRTVSTEGKAQQITATVSDVAGNTATSTVVLNIEKTAPSITASIAPPPNAAGWNNTNVTANFVCTPSASNIVSCQTPIAVTTEGKGQLITGTVTDQAGKSNTTTATVNIDKTAPSISATTAPPPNAAGWNNTNVLISYLCSDSLSGVAICPTPVTVSTEGSAESISAQATDQAGNTASVTTTLNIDRTPPLVTATAAPAPNGAGWNNTNVTVTFSCTDSLSGVATCPPQQLVASEGQNQNISGQATDIAGNVGTGSISLSIDKTPPTIVQLSTPDHVSRLHSGQVSVTVNDNFFVSQVVITVNGTSLGTFTSAPYQATLQVPAGANPGDTLTVTAVATDEAGNTQSSSRAVRVAADGVIVGQVLSDATSFPIQGAVVQTISSTSANDQTDDHGRYTLLASDSHLFLSAASAAPPTTKVEREVFVQDGVGTVPVDARLTPLTAPVSVGSAGGTVSAGNISITVPAGAVGDGTTMQLTPLTGQGLPGLLPLGWSPLAAFDFRASSSATNLTATVTQLPNSVMHLATYNPALHAWTMVAANLQSVSGGINIVVPSPGAYALVLPDLVIPPITVPDPGNPLPGIQMQLLDPAASSNGTLSPAILPPSGGTSTATLGVLTASPVPSGTVIQANVSETFSLTSGDLVSEETRSEDIVIYNALAPANTTLGAQFAVAPSHKYTNSQLLTGKVHLDILAGREGVRGQPGGSDPVTLTDGIATLSVPGGALTQDTAINVQGISLENFIPSNGSIGALQEVLVDFSGETLNTPGQLSISSTGLNPAHTFLLTQVQRIDGVPHMVLLAVAQINGANLTSVATPGLPGITQGGEYVFYDVSTPLGFVQGVVSSSAGPVQALVQTDSLPIVSITGADGKYIVPAIAGTVNLKASSPHTNLTGSASAQVTAGQTVPTNISLTGTVTNAVVSPADGTLGVLVSTTITVTTTAPLNPQSISQANLVLLKGTASSGTPVQLQPFVLSSSGTVLSFAPVANLDPATQYTIEVAGLADNFGGAVVVPVSSFTTKAVAALNFDPNAITFSFPDANGNIQVTAPAGSLPSGTQILIVDQTSGLVLTLTALNDGSVSGSFVGTINDILQISATDPTGAKTSFTKTQFVAADGTTAVGVAGGTVSGPGGLQLLIPAGALDKATRFKIEAVNASVFPVLPDVPGSIFAGGMKITSPDAPVIKKEIKLAFPVPAGAPDGAFYQAYRQLQGPQGTHAWETLDHAFVQGTGPNAQIVTASYPFSGLVDWLTGYEIPFAPIGEVLGVGIVALEVGIEGLICLTEVIDNTRPGKPIVGVITGKVLYPVPPGGRDIHNNVNNTSDTIFAPVQGAIVSGVDSRGVALVNTSDNSNVAISQADGTYTLWDCPKSAELTVGCAPFPGGVVTVSAQAAGMTPSTATGTANEVVVITDQNIKQLAGPLLPLYKNVAVGNINFPLQSPPPPPPQINIGIFTLDPNNQRQPIQGIVQSGTSLVMTFASSANLTVTGATVNGTPVAVAPDPSDTSNDGLNHFALGNNYITGAPGVYTVVATALNPVNVNTPVTTNRTFLVVAAGGSNNLVTPGVGPFVVYSTPQNNDQNVPPSSFLQITFSEPVTNIINSNSSLGDIFLGDFDDGSSPAFVVIGVRPDGSVANPVTSSDVVTSITLRPLTGLKFGANYRLSLANNIVDQNTDQNGNPSPQPLTPFVIQFKTAGLQEDGFTPNQFAATRAAVIGQHAYVGEVLNSAVSGIDTIDITVPSAPVDLGVSGSIVGRAIDAAGESSFPYIAADGSISNIPLVAIGATVGGTEFSIPPNIWLYDVSDPNHPNRIGVVSASSSATSDGTIVRIAVKGRFAYASTFNKGLQVIDLQQAIAEFQQTPVTQMGQETTTDGEGFALDAIQNTIPMTIRGQRGLDPSGNPILAPAPALMFDLKPGDFLNGAPDPNNPTAPVPTHTLIVATGRIPFVVADPQQTGAGAILYPGPDPSGVGLSQSPWQTSDGSFQIQLGRAVALETFSLNDSSGANTTEQTAILVGVGVGVLPNGQPAAGVLGVINLNDPAHPVAQSFVGLTESPTDVVLNGDTAFVGTSVGKILIVSLADLNQPVAAGEITGDFGDRLAITADGIVVATSFNGTIGGLETADGNGTGTQRPRFPRSEMGPTKDCVQSGGKPINFANGNVWLTQRDYSLAGLGRGIHLSRTWNSLWPKNNPIELIGTFGDSWRSSFDERLNVANLSSSQVQYWRGDGSEWIFQSGQALGSFTLVSPQNEHATLQVDSSTNIYTLTSLDGSKEIFNSNGYLIAMVDRNGNQTTIAYDAANRITSVTDASGRVLTFNYASAGTRTVQSISDSVGTVASYTYDQASRLLQVRYADGSAFNMTYDANGLITAVTDVAGKIIEAHSYDNNRRGLTSASANGVDGIKVSYSSAGHTQVTDSMNRITTYNSASFGGRAAITSVSGNGCASCGIHSSSSFTYDSNGNSTSRTDALGRATTYTYDSSGNILSTSTEVGSATITWSYTYNNFGELLTVSDPMGNTTTNTYDPRGNLLTVTSPAAGGASSVTKYTYNSLGEMTKVTDPLGNATTLTYTPAGLLATITNAQNKVTSYSYDARGNRTSITDALNATTGFSYDQVNRLVKITYPDSTTDQFGYDVRGRRVSATDQNGRVKTYSYDDADHLISVKDPAGNITAYTYDPEGRLTAVTDANSHTFNLSYDSFGHLVRTAFPSGLAESYSYDAVGNLTSRTDRKNQTINYSYDELNRLMQKKYPDATAVNYTYNNDSRVTGVTDATGTYQFTFDALGRVTGTSTLHPFLPSRTITSSYAYDIASNRIGFTDAEGGATTYSYDSLNRLFSMSSSVSGRFTFGYDALSRQTQMTKPNNVTTNYSFDTLSRLLSVLHQFGGSTIDGATYRMDAEGNRTARTDQRTGVTLSYGYDSTDQLLGVTQGGVVQESYTYDSLGNRLAALGSNGWTYNTSNQLVSTPSVSYTYDNNGNLLTKTDSTGTTTYTWDFEDRLTSISLPGETVNFKYDPFGRRIYKSSSTSTRIYTYDGTDITEVLDGNGAQVALFTHGPGIDQPLAVTKSGATSYFQDDGIGSITSLSNATGDLTDTYVYDSFGNSLSSTGNTDNPFRFTARELDAETGLYYYRARYYDPTIGRFISEDPVGFTGNKDVYRYAENSPVNETDPSGNWGTTPHNQLIWNALHPCGLTNHELWQIQRGSRHADDFKFQGAEYSYMHSMTNGSSNPPQTAADMAQQRDQFVATQTANAANELQQGNEDQALFDFGYAMHPLMDATSPAHVDPQGNPIPWCGLNPVGCSQFSQHGDTPWSKENLKALNARPDVQQRMNGIIRSYYESLTGRKLKCNDCK